MNPLRVRWTSPRRASPIATLPKQQALLALSLLALTFFSKEASGADKSVDACFFNFEQSQISLNEGDLVAAHAHARACSKACPTEVQKDCIQWESDTSSRLPSVLLLARFDNGSDAPDIQVEVDGVLLANGLERETSLNPGERTFVFRRSDGWSEKFILNIREGEKLRKVLVHIPKKSTANSWAYANKSPQTQTLVASSFGLGIFGLSVAAVSGIVALNLKGQLNECKSLELGCEQSLVDKTKTYITVADIGLVAGALGTLSGVSLLIWGSDEVGDKDSLSSFRFRPTLGGALGQISGSF